MVAGLIRVDIVARLKEESEVPLRSHGSLSLNRALMAAGLVDRVQLLDTTVCARLLIRAFTLAGPLDWPGPTLRAR